MRNNGRQKRAGETKVSRESKGIGTLLRTALDRGFRSRRWLADFDEAENFRSVRAGTSTDADFVSLGDSYPFLRLGKVEPDAGSLPCGGVLSNVLLAGSGGFEGVGSWELGVGTTSLYPLGSLRSSCRRAASGGILTAKLRRRCRVQWGPLGEWCLFSTE